MGSKFRQLCRRVRQRCRREYIWPFPPTLLFMHKRRSMRLNRKRRSRATSADTYTSKMGVPVNTIYARVAFHAPEPQAPFARNEFFILYERGTVLYTQLFIVVWVGERRVQNPVCLHLKLTCTTASPITASASLNISPSVPEKLS